MSGLFGFKFSGVGMRQEPKSHQPDDPCTVLIWPSRSIDGHIEVVAGVIRSALLIS